MVTIYPFVGLHPSDEAFAFVPSVPYDVKPLKLQRMTKPFFVLSEQMQNCRILIRMTIVSMSVPVRCLQR